MPTTPKAAAGRPTASAGKPMPTMPKAGAPTVAKAVAKAPLYKPGSAQHYKPAAPQQYNLAAPQSRGRPTFVSPAPVVPEEDTPADWYEAIHEDASAREQEAEQEEV